LPTRCSHHQYGLIDFTSIGDIRAIVETRAEAPTNYAVTGLYFYDEQVSDIAPPREEQGSTSGVTGRY
jgi:dTDP-glucose pyrophosphorylase